METRSKAVETWSDFSRSHLPAGALWSSTGTPFPVSHCFRPVSHRLSRFEPLMKPSPRVVGLLSSWIWILQSTQNSRPSWPSFTHPAPQNVKKWGRTDERNTQYLLWLFIDFFFFFFYNDPKNRFWCISLNDRLRVFWQITNFLYFCGKFAYFAKLIIFGKLI